jgi:predicted ATP-dependent protease
VVDIERESQLGGPIHSKGVLILSGYLAGRYAPTKPLSLSASLVFEQSYGGVEGDSASSAELYALLSALAGAPLAQNLAVTGSVNQHGDIQAIGAVNEKIEGFFDLCRARGANGQPSGNPGVVIPEANVKHLMLREDVLAAVEQGKFAVYAVRSVDEGIELLTGVPAQEIHARVESRLAEFADKARAFALAAAKKQTGPRK